MNEEQDKPPKPRADWTAWTLQLLFGLIVGACAGWLIWGRMLRLDLTTIHQWPGIIIGTALVVGALTSRRGDRTWFRSSVFDPDPPPQSPASKAASFIIGSYGVLWFCLSMFRHISPTGSQPGFSGSDFVSLLLGGFIALLVIHALRTDTAYSADGPIDREDEPFVFWLYVISGTLSVFYLLLQVL